MEIEQEITDEGIYKKTWNNRNPRLIAELVRGEEVLDVGYGQTPNIFLKNPIGIDIQKIETPNYKKVYKVNLNKQDFPFKDRKFDTIIGAGVIEHVENPSYLLREMNRTLKDGGRLMIATPQANYYWRTIRNLLLNIHNTRDSDIGEHLSNWTIMDFIRLLKRNGFEIEKIYGDHLAIPICNLFKKERKFIIIPMKNFPKFADSILYVCKKIDKPVKTIATFEARLGFDLGDWIEIPNEIQKIKHGVKD